MSKLLAWFRQYMAHCFAALALLLSGTTVAVHTLGLGAGFTYAGGKQFVPGGYLTLDNEVWPIGAPAAIPAGTATVVYTFGGPVSSEVHVYAMACTIRYTEADAAVTLDGGVATYTFSREIKGQYIGGAFCAQNPNGGAPICTTGAATSGIGDYSLDPSSMAPTGALTGSTCVFGWSGSALTAVVDSPSVQVYAAGWGTGWHVKDFAGADAGTDASDSGGADSGGADSGGGSDGAPPPLFSLVTPNLGMASGGPTGAGDPVCFTVAVDGGSLFPADGGFTCTIGGLAVTNLSVGDGGDTACGIAPANASGAGGTNGTGSTPLTVSCCIAGGTNCASTGTNADGGINKAQAYFYLPSNNAPCGLHSSAVAMGSSSTLKFPDIAAVNGSGQLFQSTYGQPWQATFGSFTACAPPSSTSNYNGTVWPGWSFSSGSANCMGSQFSSPYDGGTELIPSGILSAYIVMKPTSASETTAYVMDIGGDTSNVKSLGLFISSASDWKITDVQALAIQGAAIDTNSHVVGGANGSLDASAGVGVGSWLNVDTTATAGSLNPSIPVNQSTQYNGLMAIITSSGAGQQFAASGTWFGDVCYIGVVSSADNSSIIATWEAVSTP